MIMKEVLHMKKVQQILTLQTGIIENWQLEVASLPKQSAQATDGLWSTSVVILKDINPYTRDTEKPATNKFEKFTVKTSQKPDVELEDEIKIVDVSKAVPYASSSNGFIDSLSVTAHSLERIDSTVQTLKEKCRLLD